MTGTGKSTKVVPFVGLKHHDFNGVLEEVEQRVTGPGRGLKRIGRKHQRLDTHGHLLETFLGLGEVAFNTFGGFFLHDGERQVTPDAVQGIIQLMGYTESELAHDSQMLIEL